MDECIFCIRYTKANCWKSYFRKFFLCLDRLVKWCTGIGTVKALQIQGWGENDRKKEQGREKNLDIYFS